MHEGTLEHRFGEESLELFLVHSLLFLIGQVGFHNFLTVLFVGCDASFGEECGDTDYVYFEHVFVFCDYVPVDVYGLQLFPQ